MSEHSLEQKIIEAPESPGVYIFRDRKNKPIYIGKARNIRKRLKSYITQATGLDLRKQEMVRTAADINYIVTSNELEALALEANLIKLDRPKYNILLRDDKNYPYLRIDLHDEWPYLEVVRRVKKDRALYFGPYIPAGPMHETLALIRKYFYIRLCKYDLSKIRRPCIQHQMGKCPAPCAGLVSREEYMEAVQNVILFLKGKDRRLLDLLNNRMMRLSREERFEEAAGIRDRIAAIEGIWEKQKVVSPRLGELDVIGYAVKDNDVAFVVLFIRNGIMTGAKEFFLRNTADIKPEELLYSFTERLYAGTLVPPSHVLVPLIPDEEKTLTRWLSEKKESPVIMATARKGLKKDLLAMAEENASIFIARYRTRDHEPLLQEVQDLLGLARPPETIGAFDVSTLHGAESLGAFIAWEHGHFQKRLYRFVKIKSVQGMDDYAMMRETIVRVLNRLDLHNIPSLLVIDGGKGQLDTAINAMDTFVLEDRPDIVAVAKDPDRVFTPWQDRPLNIEDGRKASLFLRGIRDEVHRYAITQHRKARKRRLLTSSLEDIKGIGKKRRLALLKHFGSLEAIRRASSEEIANVDGFNLSLSKKIKEFLENRPV